MKTRLRVQKIVIDTPLSDSEPWVQLTIQRIEMDDDFNTLNTVDRWKQIHKRLSEFATDIVSFDDPILVSENSISGIGLGNALTSMCISWTASEFNGIIDENGFIMVD